MSHPEKLKELQAVFDRRRKSTTSVPLDSSAALRLDLSNRLSLTRGPHCVGPAAGGLLMIDGKPQFVHAYSIQPAAQSSGSHRRRTLAPGRHSIRFDFQYDSGGVGKGGMDTLLVDGKQVTQNRIEGAVPNRFSVEETFDTGENTARQ